MGSRAREGNQIRRPSLARQGVVERRMRFATLLIGLAMGASVGVAQSFSASDTQTVSISYSLGNSVDAPDQPIDLSGTNVDLGDGVSMVTDPFTVDYTFATDQTELTLDVTKVGSQDINGGEQAPRPYDVGLAAGDGPSSNFLEVRVSNVGRLNADDKWFTLVLDGEDTPRNYGTPATHSEDWSFEIEQNGAGPQENFDQAIELTFTVQEP